ncbi:heterokaryon incompatibility protein-domain-containing protein, partial [Leptodontidium sp. 2 PMI_412]
MRLLDTTTLELHEFFGSDIPYYAILSHRWEDDEVTFQDLVNGIGPSRKGYLKVQGCCRKAARDGWRYAWVDSCCIDKSSSAELSEAINSMFQWYRGSQVCYAFLSDVPEGLTIKKHHKKRSKFRKSKWWTRGWTLQELLAPRKVVFYDCGWGEIGTRGYLQGLVHSITGIRDLDNFMQASIARKMSWASKRKTKRVEDQAYCLLGIFNVNMPPLYGEGQKAFERLQLEILKTSDDESIFAW